MHILKRLQEEQRPWVKHNFGDRPGWMPLLGLGEELGELTEAYYTNPESEEVADSLADMIIFLADFSSYQGIDIFDVYNTGNCNFYVFPKDCKAMLLDMAIAVGKINHAYLKIAQGIRVDEGHLDAINQGIADILGSVIWICGEVGVDFQHKLEEVWDKVKMRDWKKFPKNGLTE